MDSPLRETKDLVIRDNYFDDGHGAWNLKYDGVGKYQEDACLEYCFSVNKSQIDAVALFEYFRTLKQTLLKHFRALKRIYILEHFPKNGKMSAGLFGMDISVIGVPPQR